MIITLSPIFIIDNHQRKSMLVIVDVVIIVVL